MVEKFDSVLAVAENADLEGTIATLNLNAVNLKFIFADGRKEKNFLIGGQEVPLSSFAAIYQKVGKLKTFVWLVSGCNAETFRKTKKFLVAFGVNADNIIDLAVAAQIQPTWLANFNYLVEHGADFFATGDDCVCAGLNFNFIPAVISDKKDAPTYQIDLSGDYFKFISPSSEMQGGVNLADTNQTLQQSYWIAKKVFANVKPGKIQMVIIGLSPESFCCENPNELCNSQHLYSVTKNISEAADVNCDSIKTKFNRAFSAKSVGDWTDNLKSVSTATVERNQKILQEYIELCKDNDAKPVGLVLPFAPVVRKTFDKNILSAFCEVIHKLEENGDFICLDMFDLNLNYDCFADMTHLNLTGNKFFCAVLSYRLYKNNFIAAESFCDMSYELINRLVTLIPKDDYNNLLEKVFEESAKKISRKDKIKLGFVVRGAAEWCGDDLYRLFERDGKFEVTVFVFPHQYQSKSEVVNNDFVHGVEQLKARNLNVVTLHKVDSVVPEQDIIISLSPYIFMMPKALREDRLKLKTLINYIPYGIATTLFPIFNLIMFNVAWKIFCPSKYEMDLYTKQNHLGCPRKFFSGYPRMDIFSAQNDFKFDWKLACPNAKKIIYAPHWSINGGIKTATFQWNYQFMYEFAKVHPEISWVVKPHPLLLSSAVENKIFPSVDAFKEYLQKWNDLPNAQVYTGAYYQNIFATSDGMIHDCGSFIAEYQYTNKPMVYLTRGGVKISELGNYILKASYTVDGKDHNAIATMMQKVFIDGDDYKAAERKAVFDKYLNYPQYNGMLASEFIYKSIVDAVRKIDE